MFKAVAFLTNGNKDWEVILCSNCETKEDAQDVIEKFKKHYAHSAPFRVIGFSII